MLGDVCQIVGGTTPSTAVAEYWGGNVVWITPADLGKLEGKKIYSSERKITEKSLEATNLQPLPVGTVVLSSRAPIGHLGIAETPLCTNQGCKSFIPSGDIDSEYLYFILKIHVADFQQLGSGSTFKEISKSTLESFEIPLPPIAEQKRIVAVLNEQMATVEKAREAALEKVEAVRALASAWLREVFSFGEGELPHGWQWIKLGDVCKTATGGTPSRNVESFYGGDIPWIKSGELNDSFVSETEETIARLGADKSNAKIFPEGTLLIALYGATVGKLGILDINAATNQAVCAIFPDNSIDRDYLFFFLLYIRKSLVHASFGGAQPNISQSIVRSLDIPLPPLTEQKRLISALSAKIATAEKARAAAEAELEATTALPSALLRRAFSGAL